MSRPKKEVVPPPQLPSQEEIEELSLGLESETLSKQAEARLKPAQIKALKKIAYYTSRVGLPLEECCALLDIDFTKFEEEMKLEPLIGKIIRAKELEYKKDLLYTLAQRARSGDDKLAQWLLERKYPNEYGSGKKKDGGDDGSGDIFLEAFRFIRKNGDSAPLIPHTQVPQVLGPNGTITPLPAKDVHVRIDDILNGT